MPLVLKHYSGDWDRCRPWGNPCRGFCRPLLPTTVKGSGPSTWPLHASGYNVVYKTGADPQQREDAQNGFQEVQDVWNDHHSSVCVRFRDTGRLGKGGVVASSSSPVHWGNHCWWWLQRSLSLAHWPRPTQISTSTSTPTPLTGTQGTVVQTLLTWQIRFARISHQIKEYRGETYLWSPDQQLDWRSGTGNPPTYLPVSWTEHMQSWGGHSIYSATLRIQLAHPLFARNEHLVKTT